MKNKQHLALLAGAIIIGIGAMSQWMPSLLNRNLAGNILYSQPVIITTPTKTLTAEPKPASAPINIFKDIPGTHPQAKSFLFLKNNNIMNGYGDGTFKPLNPMNRAEFMKTLTTAEGVTYLNTPNLQNCFKDVTNQWFAPSVCYAKQQGWIKGYSDNTFRPNNNINRAEALKIFVNVFDVPTVQEPPKPELEDFSKNQWYAPYVWGSSEAGFINSWTMNNRQGSLSPADMQTPITRIDVATATYNLASGEIYPENSEMQCEYEPLKGEGDANAHETFPPKAKYEFERTNMVIMNQDEFGKKTCFPTTSAMSFTWLKTQGQYGDLVPKDGSGNPNYKGMVDELKKDMEWNENEGVNSADATTGLAKYLKAHGLADKFTIEFITKAPKNKGFVKHDALEGKTSLDGVGFSFERRNVKGGDVVAQMKKGQDVIIGIRGHVIEIAGIDETPNADGNYDVKLAEPALGKTLGAEISPEGKLIVGGKPTTIMDLVAVSPKK